MSWSINNLINDLKKLKMEYIKEKDSIKKEEISLYIHSLEMTISNLKYGKKEIETQGLFFNCQLSMPKYKIIIPYIRKFLYTLDECDVDEEYRNIKRDKVEYDFKDLFDLTRAFYYSLDDNYKELYKEFAREKRNRINFCVGDSKNSISYIIPIINKFYLSIGASNDHRNITEAFIHEVGHVLVGKQNYKRYDSNDIYLEIESLFFEILADQFLRKEMKDPYYTDLEYKKAVYYYTSANLLDIYHIAYNNTVNNIGKIKDPNEAFLEYARKEGLLYTTPINIDSGMKYLFSYICAIELVEIYKEDKNLALELLHNIVGESNSNEYTRIINNINPCEHTKSYIKKLKKEID